MHRFAVIRTICYNLRISQDICCVRMADNNDFLAIFGHRDNLVSKFHWLKKLRVPTVSWIVQEDLFFLKFCCQDNQENVFAG